jgi:hypothetical protein
MRAIFACLIEELRTLLGLLRLPICFVLIRHG